MIFRSGAISRHDFLGKVREVNQRLVFRAGFQQKLYSSLMSKLEVSGNLRDKLHSGGEIPTKSGRNLTSRFFQSWKYLRFR